MCSRGEARHGPTSLPAVGSSLRIYPLAIYPLRIYAPRMANNKTLSPLTPAVLHILLALSTGERHGYGIMKQVEADSQGKMKMGPGTLYGSLGRMIEAGLIRESDKKVDPKMDDQRRVYYKITALGRKTLAAELDRYREVVALARRLSPNAFNSKRLGLSSFLRCLPNKIVRPLSDPFC